MKQDNRSFCRSFDIIFSLCMLILNLPVLALAAILIKIDSPGPVFHVAKRMGLNGTTFDCYKLRTMIIDADSLLPEWFKQHPEEQEAWATYKKLRGEDPRITRLGWFLRKYSLDELPQFFNVLRGDMAIVGPRPYLQRELSAMGNQARKILSVLPGITGYWQVFGRNDTSFSRRLSMDLWYIRNRSFGLDLRILLTTPFRMIS